jgi:hypothetical protein
MATATLINNMNSVGVGPSASAPANVPIAVMPFRQQAGEVKILFLLTAYDYKATPSSQ